MPVKGANQLLITSADFASSLTRGHKIHILPTARSHVLTSYFEVILTHLVQKLASSRITNLLKKKKFTSFCHLLHSNPKCGFRKRSRH